MVRLEYSDAKSNKFWEAQVEDTELHLRWGRIGTDGQTKTKSYASADKAAQELEKQKTSKLKKGYQEVSHSTATSKSNSKPAPKAIEAAPKPAATAVRAQGQVHWTDKTWAKTIPQEASVPKLGKANSLWKKATRAWRPEKWREGLGLNTPTLRQAVKVALSDPAAAEPGILLALLDGPSALLEYYLVGDKPEQALEAVVQGRDLAEGYGGYLVRRASSPFPSEEFVNKKHWTGLRKWLPALPDKARTRLLKAAEGYRENADITLRCCLSFVFPERPEWAQADARQLLNHPPQHSWGSYIPEQAWLVLHSLTDQSLMTELLEDQQHIPTWAPWPVLAKLGEKSLEIWAPKIRNHQRYVNEQLKPMLEALSLIETEEVADFFAECLRLKLSKSLKAMLSAYFQEFPELGLKVLPGRGREAESLVGALVRGNPQVAEALAEELQPSLQSSLKSVLEKVGDARPEAGPGEIPSILASPPWRQKRKASKPKILKNVVAREREGRINWEGVDKPWPYFYDRPPAKPDPAGVEAELKRWRSESSLNIFEIDRMSNPAALTFLKESPPKIWSIYQDSLLSITARFGVEAVQPLARLATRRAELAVEALAVIEHPSVAPVVAELMEKKKVAKTALRWLQEHPEIAAEGLIPVAVGPTGRARTSAENALRLLDADLVREVARVYGQEVCSAVETVLAVDPLSIYPDKLPKLPDFARPEALPQLHTRKGKALPTEAVGEALTMLAFCSLENPYAGVAVLKEELTKESLEEFCWELFESWMRAGAPAKESWAFFALGHFGGDESARRLTPLIRKWPGESSHARAVVGLDVLGKIGSDVAMMHLHGIAQKLKFKALQEKAREKIDQIAGQRNLTRDELADRLVPDLGLDPDGVLLLDYGPRQFEARFDEQLKPYLAEVGGRFIKSLPKPGKSDDEQLARAAKKMWQGLKKDARHLAGGQILRLERAMTLRRRWKPDDFRLFLVDHPLIFQLTRRLVFGGYAGEELVNTFRVAEDRTLADAQDEPLHLSNELEVGIPHPVELDAGVLKAWRELFTDYELLPPFPQLDRPIHKLDPQRLESLLQRSVPFGRILGLEHRGWERGEVWDSGVLCHYERPFIGGRAVLSFEPGLYLGEVRSSGDQTLGELKFVKGENYQEIPLKQIDPIVLSEVIYDLEEM